MSAALSTLAPVAGLASLDERGCAGLRDRLTAAGYDEALLGQAEGVAPAGLDALRLPLVRRWLANRAHPGCDLARLFSYRDTLPAARLAELFGADLAGALESAGVITPAGAGDRLAPFLLTPLGGQWFLSDPLEAGREAVMGPGMTTLVLHRLQAAWPSAARVLDLGCGAASLAIAAARSGARAIATDLTPRVAAMARFNARLNGVALDVRVGDGTQPVADERFELVLSQPPYVTLPAGLAGSTYLHGGRYGDELAMRFVVECSRVLAPGGVAALHFDTPERAEAPVKERLKNALGEAGVDLLALVQTGLTPDQQAVNYAAADHPGLGEDYARASVAYRDHLESLGIAEFRRLLVVLHRPAAGSVPGGRFRIVLQVPSIGSLAGVAVRGLLESLEVALQPDEALLRARVTLPAGVTFREERRSPAEEAPLRLLISFPPGSIAQDRELGERGWVLLGLLAAAPRVGDVLEPYAQACEAEVGEVRAEVAAFVRDALARGMLVADRPA